MEPFAKKLSKSRRAFARHGEAFVKSTRGAGVSFLDDTRSASTKFGQFVRRESLTWGDYLWTTSRQFATDSRMLFTPVGLERGLWVRVNTALKVLQRGISTRLSNLSATVKAGSGLPIADYEQLNVRDIVSQLDSLNSKQCQSIYAFEQKHKARATVLKALNQRLAA